MSEDNITAATSHTANMYGCFQKNAIVYGQIFNPQQG